MPIGLSVHEDPHSTEEKMDRPSLKRLSHSNADDKDDDDKSVAFNPVSLVEPEELHTWKWLDNSKFKWWKPFLGIYVRQVRDQGVADGANSYPT